MLKSNGGYKIIDLKSPTIYNDIESNYGKALLFTNIEIDNVEKNDVFASVEVESGKFIVYLYDRKITIDNDNNVIIENSDKHLYMITFNYSDTYINLFTTKKPSDDLNNKQIFSFENRFLLNDDLKNKLSLLIDNCINNLIIISSDNIINYSRFDNRQINYNSKTLDFNLYTSDYNEDIQMIITKIF